MRNLEMAQDFLHFEGLRVTVAFKLLFAGDM